jgi:nucleoside-diphosphate-sugar epimerase
MTGVTPAVTFVTGAEGFVGLELVTLLAVRGHQVFALTPSSDAAQRVRRAGGIPVMGNLSEPGRWQDEAAAEWVFHAPPYPLRGSRVAGRHVDAIARTRTAMDAHLLDAVAAGRTRRLVYVADAGCYGVHGSRPITEDEPRRPSLRARCLAPALDRLDGYIVAGLPIVTALPGWIYGDGGWLRERVIDPVLAGRRVLQVGRTGPWISPIHIHDCVRALVYLAWRGETGGRYFLADDEPIRLHEIAATFARLAHRSFRLRRVPRFASRLLLGALTAEDLDVDAVFSNIRLRGIGFHFQYPALEQGLQQVVGALHV